MDELERALRAVLDDPAQLQELRELAGSMGFSVPQAQPERAPVPDPPESEPKPVPGHWSPSPKDFQSYLKRLDTLKNLSPRSLPPQCCGRREKWTKGRKRCCWR